MNHDIHDERHDHLSEPQPVSESTQQEKHTTFATGAKRCEAVAGAAGQKFPMRFDLLISNTDFMKRMAATYGEGGVKYGDDNWRNGMPEKSIINHMFAHIIQHLDGDATEDHLAHAAWNLITLMWVQVNKPELMDLTALTAKGKLQPCNTFQASPDAEASAPPFTVSDNETDPEYCEVQRLMGRRIKESRRVSLTPQGRHLVIRAIQGSKLNNHDYRELVALFITATSND